MSNNAMRHDAALWEAMRRSRRFDPMNESLDRVSGIFSSKGTFLTERAAPGASARAVR